MVNLGARAKRLGKRFSKGLAASFVALFSGISGAHFGAWARCQARFGTQRPHVLMASGRSAYHCPAGFSPNLLHLPIRGEESSIHIVYLWRRRRTRRTPRRWMHRRCIEPTCLHIIYTRTPGWSPHQCQAHGAPVFRGRASKMMLA